MNHKVNQNHQKGRQKSRSEEHRGTKRTPAPRYRQQGQSANQMLGGPITAHLASIPSSCSLDTTAVTDLFRSSHNVRPAVLSTGLTRFTPHLADRMIFSILSGGMGEGGGRKGKGKKKKKKKKRKEKKRKEKKAHVDCIVGALTVFFVLFAPPVSVHTQPVK